jgi:hypothetical protein
MQVKAAINNWIKDGVQMTRLNHFHPFKYPKTMQFYYAAAATFLASAFGAATTVRKVNNGPTGYVVDFVFTPNATTHPKFVLLGGFPLYSDSLHASASKTAGYSPWQWKPDDFSMGLFVDLGSPATIAGLNMTLNSKTGDWELTVPFPSGTFNYAYSLDCINGSYLNCAGVVDPSNLPLELYPGDQLVSTIQVPFDSKYQANDYDWQLPLENQSQRGSISFQHYPSPNSTYPSPGRYPSLCSVLIHLF